jgi:hypothetical protein
MFSEPLRKVIDTCSNYKVNINTVDFQNNEKPGFKNKAQLPKKHILNELCKHQTFFSFKYEEKKEGTNKRP